MPPQGGGRRKGQYFRNLVLPGVYKGNADQQFRQLAQASQTEIRGHDPRYFIWTSIERPQQCSLSSDRDRVNRELRPDTETTALDSRNRLSALELVMKLTHDARQQRHTPRDCQSAWFPSAGDFSEMHWKHAVVALALTASVFASPLGNAQQGDDADLDIALRLAVLLQSARAVIGAEQALINKRPSATKVCPARRFSRVQARPI